MGEHHRSFKNILERIPPETQIEVLSFLSQKVVDTRYKIK